ncbi:MAG TPA: hypothetical protein VJV78_40540, partial [Polyangiales bacterium]|nr:hypothetical protein [Polyangiales bacterium]
GSEHRAGVDPSEAPREAAPSEEPATPPRAATPPSTSPAVPSSPPRRKREDPGPTQRSADDFPMLNPYR